MRLTLINDPGHGWLSVPIKAIKDAGITDKVSRYSYMTPTRVYLEEDCDLLLFIKATGLELEGVRDTYSDNLSSCRGYGTYDPYWIHNPLKMGSAVKVHGDEQIYTVREIGKRHIIIRHKDTIFRVPKDRAFRYLRIPSEQREEG